MDWDIKEALEEGRMSPALAEAMDQAFHRGNGAHWTVSEPYEEGVDALKLAFWSGQDFTTGWYSSKKEIQSGRISRTGSKITCEVSVSDDFDTPGTGSVEFELGEGVDVESILEEIRKALLKASDRASSDQDDNAVYVGFSIIKNGSWVETYIAQKGEGWDLEYPPGDNYGEWGWQHDSEEEIPAEVKTRMEAWIADPEEDEETEYNAEGTPYLKVGDWTVIQWE